jgi:Cys-tRNA synthase (O-phospho-L-seryl-tRNA:Cys-tRNA synthase)
MKDFFIALLSIGAGYGICYLVMSGKLDRAEAFAQHLRVEVASHIPSLEAAVKKGEVEAKDIISKVLAGLKKL